MLRFLADENFNADLIQAAIKRGPNLHLVSVHDVGLTAADDPTVLQWCADNDCVLLTHDMNTMPGYAYDRVRAGLKMPGVFEVPQHPNISQIVDCGFLR